MKKILMVALCLVIVPMLFAAESDADVANKTVEPTSAEPTMTSPRKLLVDYTPRIKRSGSRDLLWSQIPNPATALGLACQLDTVYPMVADISDDIDPPEQWIIDSVTTWWACWNGFTTWALVPYIDFLVYNDNGSTWPEDSAFVKVRVPQTNYTATSIGTDQYFVEMTLPTPVILPGGAKYWVEVRPCTDFSVNGQTGWMGEVGIGNGQELYFRFPVLGVPNWVTSTTQWGFQYEVGFELYGSVGAAAFWDFEDGLQGWTHTNGQAFPAGWDVEPYDVHSSYACPDPGDSSMWIDSDAGGNGFWIQDTALSPAVVPPTNMEWLVYGVGFSGGSGSWIDDLYVGIYHFTAGAWTAVELEHYVNGTTFVGWDTLDVSAYNTADSIRVWYYFDDSDTWGYYAAFDNVGLYAPPDHDVGCSQIVSPPEGSTPAADYDVIGRIQNFGADIETFDVTANVFDTVGMTLVFDQTVTLTDFPVAGDSNVNFGTVTFAQDSVYYTKIYTELVGDMNPANDTSAILSWTGMTPGEIVFELDAEAITGDIRLVGVEFDGEYFYVTGATDMTQTKVYVIDTAGTLMHSYNQPAHSTGWGWRDIAWDYAYRGPDRIDTLYSSVDGNVDKWSYDFVGDSIIHHGFFDGPENPNRALAYDGDDNWFFTADFNDPLYKFNKDTLIIQTVANPGYAMYGAAYDAGHAGPPTVGPWLWWHSQDDPGTGFDLQIEQMDPNTMVFTGVILGPVPTMSATGTAGGLCYWSDFRGMDVLFGMNQGTPDHIFGVYLRMTPTGIEEEPGVRATTAFGFAPMTNPTKGSAISYITTTQGNVSLKVYDGTGRLVETLVNSVQPAGVNTVNWDTRNIANGVYFFKLESVNQSATHKLILVK